MFLKYDMDEDRTTAPLRKKRRYGKLTLEQKIQIIRAAERGHSQRTLASQYHCGKTQVHLLITQKEMWLAKWERLGKRESIPLRKMSSPVSEINSFVWDFYKKACTSNLTVTAAMLQERATQVSKSLSCPNFRADKGWLDSFLSNFDVKLSNNEDSTGLLLIKELGGQGGSIFDGYSTADVFNLGMVELQYRAVPGGFVGKRERLTLCVSCCASGDKEIQSVVFSDNACQESELWNVTVPCFSSPKGEVTAEVYQHSLNILNSEMAQQMRNILLIVDESNFPDVERQMSNITIQPYPKEPLHEGIVYRFKLLYYHRLLLCLAAHADDWSCIDKMAEQLPMWRIMKIVQSAWNQVPSDIIQNCFIDCGILQQQSKCDSTENDDSLLQDILRLVKLVKNESDDVGGFTYGTDAILDEIFNNEQQAVNSSEEGDELLPYHEKDAIIPLGANEALPTLTRLEALVQTLSDVDSPEQRQAMKLIDQLERVVENILVTKKSTEMEHQNDVLMVSGVESSVIL